MEKSRLEYTRERDNGFPKSLHISSSVTQDIFINGNHQLFSYDHLISVDTNTHYLNGSSVSLTAAYHLKVEGRNNSRVFCNGGVLALLEFWNICDKPENVGWWQVLQAIQGQASHFRGNIGLIVDSDLGNHDAYNNRDLPIFQNFYLPENVTLIYASDKGGPEHLSTKMIKYCHDLAKDLYVPHKLMLSVDLLFPGITGIYSHFRQWNCFSGEMPKLTD